MSCDIINFLDFHVFGMGNQKNGIFRGRPQVFDCNNNESLLVSLAGMGSVGVLSLVLVPGEGSWRHRESRTWNMGPCLHLFPCNTIPTTILVLFTGDLGHISQWTSL